MKRPMIYVAGPITHGYPDEVIRNAILAGEALYEEGFAPFIPHTGILWGVMYPKTWKQWLDLDFEYIRRCDALFRCAGKSEGADREVEFANANNIPVFESVADAARWKRQEYEDDL